MIPNRKIPAFTLSEILVVLVITAIVVGLAFSVLELVQQNYRKVRENYRVSNEINELEQQLTFDFNRYHTISYHPERQEVSFKTPLDSVNYELHGHTLTRQEDTVARNIEMLRFFFKGEETSKGNVDALKVHFSSKNEIELFVFKINDLKTYMTGNGY